MTDIRRRAPNQRPTPELAAGGANASLGRINHERANLPAARRWFARSLARLMLHKLFAPQQQQQKKQRIWPTRERDERARTKPMDQMIGSQKATDEAGICWLAGLGSDPPRSGRLLGVASERAPAAREISERLFARLILADAAAANASDDDNNK